MIRVVLRHVDDAEGAIVGDFLPSEIDGLIDRLRWTDIYVGEHELCKLDIDPFQWTYTDEARPHAIFEILVSS